MKILKNEQGFTLIEALVSMLLLTIGILSMYSMQINAIKGNVTARDLTEASTLAGDQIEQMLGAVTVTDTNGDGVAGLDAVTAGTADVVSVDDRYTIYMNLAADTLVPGVNQIRTIVQWQADGRTKSVTYDHLETP